MTHAGYVFAGWALVSGSLAVYAWRVLARGRFLARRVPEREQPWR